MRWRSSPPLFAAEGMTGSVQDLWQLSAEPRRLLDLRADLTRQHRAPRALLLSAVSAWRAVRTYALQCGLPAVKPHDFRRFVGTKLARWGTSGWRRPCSTTCSMSCSRGSPKGCIEGRNATLGSVVRVLVEMLEPSRGESVSPAVTPGACSSAASSGSRPAAASSATSPSTTDHDMVANDAMERGS